MTDEHKDPESNEDESKECPPADDKSKDDQSMDQEGGTGEQADGDDKKKRTIIGLLHGSSLQGLSKEDVEKRRRDVTDGINLVYHDYSKRIQRFARRRFPYLSSEDLADAWSDTLLNIMRRALRGKFKQTGSLHWLLKRIMIRRCIDRINRRKRKIYELLWENIEDWADDYSVPPHVIDEIHWLLEEAIAELPPRQKRVWIEYQATGFCMTAKELAVELTAKTGRKWTEASVRRARQEGRKKIKLFFRERGYDV